MTSEKISEQIWEIQEIGDQDNQQKQMLADGQLVLSDEFYSHHVGLSNEQWRAVAAVPKMIKTLEMVIHILNRDGLSSKSEIVIAARKAIEGLS